MRQKQAHLFRRSCSATALRLGVKLLRDTSSNKNRELLQIFFTLSTGILLETVSGERNNIPYKKSDLPPFGDKSQSVF